MISDFLNVLHTLGFLDSKILIDGPERCKTLGVEVAKLG